MVISLTTTPMMCAHLLKEQGARLVVPTSERFFTWMVNLYGRTLVQGAGLRAITLMILLGTIALTVYLFIRVPKGFFPQQDNGRMVGSIQADQDTSFQAMDKILLRWSTYHRKPDRYGERFTGGGAAPGGAPPIRRACSFR
jgi:multidrug efflux pump